MGRRNTKPKSTYRSLNSYESFASVDSSGTPSWLGSDWLQSDKALLHGEVPSDQLTRWCCIDRLSSQRLPGKWIISEMEVRRDRGTITPATRRTISGLPTSK